MAKKKTVRVIEEIELTEFSLMPDGTIELSGIVKKSKKVKIDYLAEPRKNGEEKGKA